MADGSPVAGRPSTGTTYYYLYDGLGSVIAMTDGSGAIVRSYKYDPYGNTVTNTGSGPVDYLRYTGAYNASGGYYHLGARYYDPAAANWTQQDPINQTTSLTQSNRYAYVGDSPTNFIDPDGEVSYSPQTPCASVAYRKHHDCSGDPHKDILQCILGGVLGALGGPEGSVAGCVGAVGSRNIG
jgi:RHS repeat-associated protein